MILVIEDNDILRKLIARLLLDEGHPVLEVSDGLEGLTIAREEPRDVEEASGVYRRGGATHSGDLRGR
jgi:CheY-like chemotaxis protein